LSEKNGRQCFYYGGYVFGTIAFEHSGCGCDFDYSFENIICKDGSVVVELGGKVNNIVVCSL
jgi:hypothetical protein